MDYQRIIRVASETPWAILPSKLAEIETFLTRKATGERFTPEEIQAVTGGAARAEQGVQRIGSVAIVPVLGTISPRINVTKSISDPGGTSINVLSNQLRELAEDPQVSSIVLDVNSPGGAVGGVPEAADLILQLREKKRIVAVANGMAASAAYWLGAAASEFVVTPSGQVGSIGVLMMHRDVSKAMEAEGVRTTFIHAGKYKVEGNPYEPLSEGARAEMQRSVDSYYDMFVESVAAGRKTTAAKVNADFGQGRMLQARDAKRAGMVDRVGTMDDTISRLLARAAARNGGGARAEIHTIRDFEAFLRDAGWSQTEAKRYASEGFPKDGPRDEGGEQPAADQPSDIETQELRQALEGLRDTLRA